jgi:putative transcriptional regulator
MRSSIAESITSTIKDLNKSGIVDEITMKNIQSLCVPAVKEYKSEKIISLRKRFHLSQAALAHIFNISPSTVQKWEQGNKNPTGASKKLLDIIERKGIEALL